MNMKSAYHIGTIWGIPLKIHISLFLLLGYISLRTLFTALQQSSMFSALLQVAVILLLQCFIFLSIALHELGHSYVALHKGCKVREITLLIIGGAAIMENIPRKPRDEFLMAIAGPAVSASLALLFGAGAWMVWSASGPILNWLRLFLFFTAIANGVLAGFNLIPAYPMDGGRLLRALLSPRLGRLRATRAAATAGRGFAILLGVVALTGLPPILPPMNIPLLLIAGFIFFAGNREYQQVQIETLMQERGFAGPFGAGGPSDEHTAWISPPPYRSGPADQSYVEREDPFR